MILTSTIDLSNIIGNYAFPIVMCIALFWKINKQDEQHKEESEKFGEAINNNTNAISALVELVRTKIGE